MSTRRVFLKSGFGLSGSLLLGCGGEGEIASRQGAVGDAGAGPGPANDAGGQRNCDAPFAGAEYGGVVPFVGESELPLEQAFNQGLDGRLYTDLSKLGPDALITPNEAFYVRTRYPDQLVPESPWTIRVRGLVQAERTLVLDDLLERETPQGTHVLECSGNARGASFGLMSSAAWHGVPLLQALEEVTFVSSATRVLVSGFDGHSQPSANNHSTPGASWVFSFEQLEESGAFLATRMNDEPLPPDHGQPVRLYVPGWYGCTCIKWVNEIVLVDEAESATSQMLEFASRTHQSGVPTLARDYIAASMDTAAMPVRVERWRRGGRESYRVIGIVWGGQEPVSELEIRFGDGPWTRLRVCPAPGDARSWALWEHVWEPSGSGTFDVALRVPNPSIRTRRLDTEYYLRSVAI